MEDTRIGMDEVKKQVYAIVDVMKYNKKRAIKGMGNSGFQTDKEGFAGVDAF